MKTRRLRIVEGYVLDEQSRRLSILECVEILAEADSVVVTDEAGQERTEEFAREVVDAAKREMGVKGIA